MRNVIVIKRLSSINRRASKRHLLGLTFSLLLATASFAIQVKAASEKNAGGEAKATPSPTPDFQPESTSSTGNVTVEGGRVDYQAVAGTLVVHPKGYDDAALPGGQESGESENDHEKNPTAEASMFFVAYNKQKIEADKRPVTFLFNGGPGSSTVWLHMGAFGPRRVITADDAHTPAAPYQIANNDYSLLDASDLVFVDAPGTGFSRIAGKDKEKSFYGVDPDAHAFAEFIVAYLSKYGRWNSPSTSSVKVTALLVPLCW